MTQILGQNDYFSFNVEWRKCFIDKFVHPMYGTGAEICYLIRNCFERPREQQFVGRLLRPVEAVLQELVFDVMGQVVVARSPRQMGLCTEKPAKAVGLVYA